MFSEDGEQVALIKKTKPEWQKGFWNGIGGKIENLFADVRIIDELLADMDRPVDSTIGTERRSFGETPENAMVREFEEETGLLYDNWKQFSVLSGKDWNVYCFVAITDEVFKIKTTTEETVQLHWLNNLREERLVENLRWLLPQALHYITVEKVTSNFYYPEHE